MRRLLLLLLLPGAAQAHGINFDGPWLGPGLHFGCGLSQDSCQLGAEVSLAMLEEVGWSGFYLDGVYAFGEDTTRLGAGLELGYLFFGVDGGVVVDTAQEGVGWRVRGLLTFAMQSVWVGRLWLPDEAERWEVGLLLKVPLPLD